MEREGLVPNRITFNTLIHALARVEPRLLILFFITLKTRVE